MKIYFSLAIGLFSTFAFADSADSWEKMKLSNEHSQHHARAEMNNKWPDVLKGALRMRAHAIVHTYRTTANSPKVIWEKTQGLNSKVHGDHVLRPNMKAQYIFDNGARCYFYAVRCGAVYEIAGSCKHADGKIIRGWAGCN